MYKKLFLIASLCCGENVIGMDTDKGKEPDLFEYDYESDEESLELIKQDIERKEFRRYISAKRKKDDYYVPVAEIVVLERKKSIQALKRRKIAPLSKK
jgi:hypothetical protein